MAGLVALVADVFPCLAQGEGVATGTWRIEPAPEAAAKEDPVTLRTSALDSDGTSLALRCRPDVSLYEFVIRDRRLGTLEPGAETRIAIRHPQREPARMLGSARGDGSVVIQERVHQTTFSLLLAALGQDDAGTIELAIADARWLFPLRGFAAALQSLIARCGFEPDPTRARGTR